MVRRTIGKMRGERYLGNTNTKEVHDLDREDKSKSGCQIDEIICAGHARPFRSLRTAHKEGYSDCAKCIGESERGSKR